MEESTIQEETVETSNDVTVTDDTVETDTSTSEDTTSQTEQTTQDTSAATQETETPTVDYEKQYKELQAEYTRKSQEYAEFKRQHQPQVIDEKGKPTSQFEQKFNYDLANFEYSSYLNNARFLDADTRAEVENLLDQANNAYVQGNTRGYEDLMAQVKENFNPRFIEQVRDQVSAYKTQKQAYINKAVAEQRQANAVRIGQEVEKVPELYNLVNSDSETYSKPVFDVVAQMFNLTGGLDVNLAVEAVKAIKNIAINEYKASQAIEKTKQQAGVLTGDNAQNPQNTQLSIDNKEFWEKRYS